MPKKTKNVAKHTPGSAIPGPPLSLVTVSESAVPPSSVDSNPLAPHNILCQQVLLDSRLLFAGSRCREVSEAVVMEIESSITSNKWL